MSDEVFAILVVAAGLAAGVILLVVIDALRTRRPVRPGERRIGPLHVLLKKRTRACRDCGGVVSTRAKTCPHCGTRANQPGPVAQLLAGVLVIGVFLTCCSGLLTMGRGPHAGGGSSHTSSARIESAGSPTAPARDLEESLKAYRATLEAAGADSDVILNISARDSTVKVQVANAWHYEPYQVRLQMAQNLWEIWARIHSPEEPDLARLELVDANGNRVGGSRVWGGSLIWVQE